MGTPTDIGDLAERLTNVENAVRVLVKAADAPTPDPTRETTLREVLAELDSIDRFDHGSSNPYAKGNSDGISECLYRVKKLLTAPAPQPPEPRLVVSGLEIDGLIGRLRETTNMLHATVEQLHDYGHEPTVAADRAISENDQLIIDLRAAVERQKESPPADGLVEALRKAKSWLEATDFGERNSGRALYQHIGETLAAYEQERERAKEGGDG